MKPLHSRLLSLASLALLLSAMAAPQAVAQHQRLGRNDPKLAEGWMNTIQEVDEMLQAGEWKRARRVTNGVLSKMCDSIESGEGAGELLATAALLRAVAQAGLGNETDANWDWHISLALKPNFDVVDFSLYGEAGKTLHAYREHSRSEKERRAKDDEDLQSALSENDDSMDGMERAEKIRSPSPKFPWATHNACIEGATILQMTINKEGRLIRPTVIESPNAVQTFSALDQLRAWRFKPARKHGEPVETNYNLTVNFGVPFCSNPYARAHKAPKGS